MAKKITLEENFKSLESIIIELEDGGLSLDESLKAFERGIKLTKSCQKSLQTAEQKIQILTKNTLNAELEPFPINE